MLSRSRFINVNVKAFLGNGNTKVIQMKNVPSNETIHNVKQVLQMLLDVNIARILIFRLSDDDDEKIVVSLCEADDAKVSSELLMYVGTARNSSARNLAFRPSSAYARNRVSRIEYNYYSDTFR